MDTIKDLYIKEGNSDEEFIESNKNFLAYLARLRFGEELNKDREKPFTIVHFTTDKGLEDMIKDQSIKALGTPGVNPNLSTDGGFTWGQGRIYGIIPEKLNQELRKQKEIIDSKGYHRSRAYAEYEIYFDHSFYGAGLQKLPQKAIALDIQLDKVGIAPDLIERGGFDSYIYWTETNTSIYWDNRSNIKKAPMNSWKKDLKEKNGNPEHEEHFYRVPREETEIKFKKVNDIKTFQNYQDAVYFIARRLDKDFRQLFCKKMIGNSYNSREVGKL